MQKPRALKKGDTIYIVAPASPTEKEKIEQVKNAVENLGFNVIIGESCVEEFAYLSGKDEVRARDLNKAFKDNNVHGIFCMRGGYGTPRILDMLDYDTIKNNPKVFNGFSDITSLHVAINQKSNLVTFHGPMVASNMLEDFDDFTKESFMRTITFNEGFKIENPRKKEIETLVGGKAEGEIIGGNLTLIVTSLGTEYEIDTKGKLLFIEEIGEPPYKIDRMLTQLRLANKFKDVAGIIFGDFNNCIPKEGHKSFEIKELICQIVAPCGKPIVYNVKSGHCKPMITLPFGVKTLLDADNGEILVLENTVRA